MYIVLKGTRKEIEAMKVYLVWYRNSETHEAHLWGIYDTAEKAESNKHTAENIGFLAWVNEEEVQ
jgi:hypothetical protein